MGYLMRFRDEKNRFLISQNKFRFWAGLVGLTLVCSVPASADPSPACPLGNAGATLSTQFLAVDSYAANSFVPSTCGTTLTSIWLYVGNPDPDFSGSLSAVLYHGTTQEISTGYPLPTSMPVGWVSMGVGPLPLVCGDTYTLLVVSWSAGAQLGMDSTGSCTSATGIYYGPVTNTWTTPMGSGACYGMVLTPAGEHPLRHRLRRRRFRLRLPSRRQPAHPWARHFQGVLRLEILKRLFRHLSCVLPERIRCKYLRPERLSRYIDGNLVIPLGKRMTPKSPFITAVRRYSTRIIPCRRCRQTGIGWKCLPWHLSAGTTIRWSINPMEGDWGFHHLTHVATHTAVLPASCRRHGPFRPLMGAHVSAWCSTPARVPPR